MKLFQSTIKDMGKAKIKVILAERKDEYVYACLRNELQSATIGPEHTMSNYLEVNANECEVNEVLSFVSRSLFVSTRMLVLNCSTLKAMGRKAGDKREYKKVPTFDSVLLEALNSTKIDVTVLIAAIDVDKRSALYKQIQSDGIFVECKPLEVKKVKELIGSELKQNNQSMSTEVLEQFLSFVDLDCSIILRELEKLALLDIRQIKSSDIETHVVKSHSYVAFELGNAISARNVSTALDILHSLIGQSVDAFQIVGLLQRQIHILYNLRVCKGDTSKQLGISPYFLNKYRDQAKGFKIGKLERFIRSLLDCEAELRSSGSNEELLLESLVIELCL